MKKPVSKAADDVTIADEEFHCRGAFGPLHKGRPNTTDLAKVAAFAKAITNA